MHIAAEGPLMAEFAQKVAYTGMVLQIPRRQVGWQPLNLEGPGSGTRRERPLQDEPKRGGIPLCPSTHPVVKIALRPEIFRWMRTRPRLPNIRASAIARSVASWSSATYTRPARRNSGSHDGYQPPVS